MCEGGQYLKHHALQIDVGELEGFDVFGVDDEVRLGLKLGRFPNRGQVRVVQSSRAVETFFRVDGQKAEEEVDGGRGSVGKLGLHVATRPLGKHVGHEIAGLVVRHEPRTRENRTEETC